MNGRPEEARPVGGEDCDADEMHTKGNGKSPTKDPTVRSSVPCVCLLMVSYDQF